MSNETGPTKGTYGKVGLPVAKTYVYPRPRGRLLMLAAALGLLTAVVLAGNVAFQRSSLISNGPLSSAHANLETNCAACHTSFETVSNEKCAACHESPSDRLGVYTFNAHYVYVSGDRTRAAVHDGETACVACHVEHTGRDVALAAVSDSRCAACHGFDSLGDGHPQFDFAAEGIPDDQDLTFTHIAHVERVLDRRDLDDLEVACLACHIPTRDGRQFQPIDFDLQCVSCHLGADIQSAELEIHEPETPIVSADGTEVALQLGVETLETIRERQGPGELWTRSVSSAAFSVENGFVAKFGIDHKDRWITHNLRRLRRALYPGGGLDDLLVSSGRLPANTPGGDRRLLYDEALATLREYADGLRGRNEPFVQDELAEIERQLADVDRRLRAPSTVLNDARFRVGPLDARLTPDQVDQIDEFARLVAEPCTGCHTVEHATIARVQQDQRVLRRARFDHRAHVLQRGCLDCHQSIPFVEYFDDPDSRDPAVDPVGLQNLPRLEQCQQCHTPRLASDRCVTCHDFHPDERRLSRLIIE